MHDARTRAVALPNAKANKMRYTVTDRLANRLAEGVAKPESDSSFHLSLPLPKNPNLGPASPYLELTGPAAKNFRYPQHEHYFEIEEFRRPEYEVSVQASAGPHLVGEPPFGRRQAAG